MFSLQITALPLVYWSARNLLLSLASKRPCPSPSRRDGASGRLSARPAYGPNDQWRGHRRRADRAGADAARDVPVKTLHLDPIVPPASLARQPPLSSRWVPPAAR
ncbi:hypothetical protein [Bosea sp. 117]|uniref:hypothetical protein n=1 Tax=Bosea sp. 117 TaxID=1125973 RepID=UPI0012DE6004|nr:hypothetical protein [Bosea sp. 117]